MGIKVGLVGATGMVGEAFIKLIEERNFPINELRPFASQRSLGQQVNCKNKSWVIQTLDENCFQNLDVVFFSSGEGISEAWAPKAVSQGAFAIDNSSAFRMTEGTPLIVPEINSHLLPDKNHPCIIANPNCSTIQLVMALHPLHQNFGIESVIVSTYQSVSGAGKEAQQELLHQAKHQAQGKAIPQPKAFSHQILNNCLPEIGSFNEDGYCTEEVKIINETKKILSLPELSITAFTVRVPTLNGHGESVFLTLNKPVEKKDIESCFDGCSGLTRIDDPKNSLYPTVVTADTKDDVFIGRLHKDIQRKNSWIFWVVADNIRKGAALNGLQIAEKIFC